MRNKSEELLKLTSHRDSLPNPQQYNIARRLRLWDCDANALIPLQECVVQSQACQSTKESLKAEDLYPWLVAKEHNRVNGSQNEPLTFVETRKCHIFIHFIFRYSSHFIIPLTFYHTISIHICGFHLIISTLFILVL